MYQRQPKSNLHPTGGPGRSSPSMGGWHRKLLLNHQLQPLGLSSLSGWLLVPPTPVEVNPCLKQLIPWRRDKSQELKQDHKCSDTMVGLRAYQIYHTLNTQPVQSHMVNPGCCTWLCHGCCFQVLFDA